MCVEKVSLIYTVRDTNLVMHGRKHQRKDALSLLIFWRITFASGGRRFALNGMRCKSQPADLHSPRQRKVINAWLLTAAVPVTCL